MKRFAFLLLAALAPAVHAGVLMTPEKALQIAFPGQTPASHALTLSGDEKAALQAAAKARVETSSFTYYSGRLADGTPGRAFIETHVVRTMPETFMTVVDASGTVRFVELLSFYEPGDYLPPKKWLQQFRGKPLDDNLLVKRGLRNVTGATLTTQALTDGVRRALALSAVIDKRESEGKAK